MVSEAPGLEIILIGLQSPPKAQTTAAADRGIWQVNAGLEVQLRKVPWNESAHLYESMERKINDALGQGQMPIMVWSTNEVTA